MSGRYGNVIQRAHNFAALATERFANIATDQDLGVFSCYVHFLIFCVKTSAPANCVKTPLMVREPQTVCHLYGLLVSVLRLLIRVQIDGRRGTQTQFIRRVLHEHANLIDETRPQLLGLHGLRCELGHG